MDTILHRTLIAHVVDQNLRPQLADALDPSFALLQPRRIPGKVEIDEGTQSLEVEPFRCGVRPDDQTQFSTGNPLLDLIAVQAAEFALLDYPRFCCAGLDGDDLCRQAFGQSFPQPEDRIVILAENDAAQRQPSARDGRAC